jgi:hypothetical protein
MQVDDAVWNALAIIAREERAREVERSYLEGDTTIMYPQKNKSMSDFEHYREQARRDV